MLVMLSMSGISGLLLLVVFPIGVFVFSLRLSRVIADCRCACRRALLNLSKNLSILAFILVDWLLFEVAQFALHISVCNDRHGSHKGHTEFCKARPQTAMSCGSVV